MRKWIKSLNFAIEGILHAAKTERHVRFHLFLSIVILLLSLILGVTSSEFIMLTIVAGFVIVTEMINSTIENLVDLVTPHKNEKARIVKDTAAGAVLIVSCVAFIVGYIIFKPYIIEFAMHGIAFQKHSSDELVSGSIIIVLITVIFLKTLFGSEHPLRGGMPSGHTALAFSIWVSLTFITKNYIVSIAMLASAVIIAQSRIMLKIHSILEVFIGAIVGSAITALIFFLFY